MDELIKKFNINIIRIRKANKFFRDSKGNINAEQELNNIIDDCNNICNQLKAMNFDISKLDMNIT